MKHLLAEAAIPLLLTIGLTIFTQSFFLSRKSFTTRSSCHGASQLLSTLGLNDQELDFLQKQGWINDINVGCWTPRRVDSLIILVVDALRFDFARDHLPLSVGSRIHGSNNQTRGYSHLYQFVADPPTVTMQRLKALTTGGLPTFADITGSFGGASVEEDSWVEQLINTRMQRAQRVARSGNIPKIAFVGDDTWFDLFPTQFDDSHPYPSFNTRDLDTVDDGCLMHLPRLLDRLIGLHNNEKGSINSTAFELVVAHFLGVDHVGHTYGPNDPHMERKLHQMDVMLSNALDTIDAAPSESCVAAYVFGDHGMTEDGNHGGGTSEERNAGLFAHYSPGCRNGREETLDGGEIGVDSIQAFDSINQIDLVPTISLLLGLPIPYANIGGLVPELLPSPRGHESNSERKPSSSTPHAAVDLALNAAQVYKYFSDYSKTSRDLPVNRLKELKELLDSATLVYKDALKEAMLQSKKEEGGGDADYNDSIAFRQACSLYKIFLTESTDLGKRVWTQFNESGMIMGIGLLSLAWLIAFPLWRKGVRTEFCRLVGSADVANGIKGHKVEKGTNNTHLQSIQSLRLLEIGISFLFMIFQCGIVTFGNSYIENERSVVTFFLSLLCFLVFVRWYYVSPSGLSLHNKTTYLPLVVAFTARLNDIFVTGHGLDPSIRLHGAHHSLVFLSSLFGLAILRLRWLGDKWVLRPSSSILISSSGLVDAIAIMCLALSWWEKRLRDHSRNGFYMARLAIVLTFLGLLHSAYTVLGENRKSMSTPAMVNNRVVAQLALYRVMFFIVIVTGPSTASTALLIFVQTAAMCQMMEISGPKQVSVILDCLMCYLYH
jgi:phosphatidylinositol glycan class O